MALDKLVDSTQLDGAMTATANAIRGKTGGSSQIAWDAANGFKAAVEAISTGTDVSDTTATAGDVLSGKYFYTANGTKTQGSIASKTSADLTASVLTVTAPAGHYASDASKTLTDANLVAGNIKKDVSIFGVTGSYEGGGGGGGLVYESGTITPASDSTTLTGTFANSHNDLPAVLIIADAKNTYSSTTNSNAYFSYINWYDLLGAIIYTRQDSSNILITTYRNRGSSQTTMSNQSSVGNTLPTWLSSSSFEASPSSAYYWRAGRTYKWIAVWAPVIVER